MTKRMAKADFDKVLRAYSSPKRHMPFAARDEAKAEEEEEARQGRLTSDEQVRVERLVTEQGASYPQAIALVRAERTAREQGKDKLDMNALLRKAAGRR